MKRQLLGIACLLLALGHLRAQVSISIAAVDPATGEVGSAGAACVDLVALGYPADFMTYIENGVGVVNVQAAWHSNNQIYASGLLLQGRPPQEIIDSLVAHDFQGTPEVRQYGIVAFVNGQPQSAAYTGANCYNFKGQIQGPNFAIQGNLLQSQAILDSMHAHFLAADGDLACKLMAAMQGANRPGADLLCTSNNTSSLFAYLNVVQPGDTFIPSLRLGVRTVLGSGIEPIDSLQSLFDAAHACNSVGTSPAHPIARLHISPNPAHSQLQISVPTAKESAVTYTILDALGRVMRQQVAASEAIIEVEALASGLYFLHATDGTQHWEQRFVKD